MASGNVGIGFAVPSNTVKDVVAQIMRTRPRRPRISVSEDAEVAVEVAEMHNLPLGEGCSRGVGEERDRRRQRWARGGDTEVVVAGETFVLGGDIVVSVDGKQISSVEQLRDAIAGHKPGDKVKLADLPRREQVGRDRHARAAAPPPGLAVDQAPASTGA